VDAQTVSMVADAIDKDDQGYLLRYVLAGDVFVNFDLVRKGAALVALNQTLPACLDTLLAAEKLARDEKTGFWGAAAGTPLPPQITPLEPPCDCNVKYSCTDFASQPAAQACYNACGDYRNAGLDPDHNGLACDE
jgi:hypothetical protein